MLATVAAPVLVMAGDHHVIRPDHTLTIAQGIPGSQLAIVPDAGDLVTQDRPALLELMIRELLEQVG